MHCEQRRVLEGVQPMESDKDGRVNRIECNRTKRVWICFKNEKNPPANGINNIIKFPSLSANSNGIMGCISTNMMNNRYEAEPELKKIVCKVSHVRQQRKNKKDLVSLECITLLCIVVHCWLAVLFVVCGRDFRCLITRSTLLTMYHSKWYFPVFALKYTRIFEWAPFLCNAKAILHRFKMSFWIIFACDWHNSELDKHIIVLLSVSTDAFSQIE